MFQTTNQSLFLRWLKQKNIRNVGGNNRRVSSPTALCDSVMKRNVASEIPTASLYSLRSANFSFSAAFSCADREKRWKTWHLARSCLPDIQHMSSRLSKNVEVILIKHVSRFLGPRNGFSHVFSCCWNLFVLCNGLSIEEFTTEKCYQLHGWRNTPRSERHLSGLLIFFAIYIEIDFFCVDNGSISG